MTLTTDITLRVQAKLTNVQDLVTARADTDALFTLALANGVGAGQADQIFSDERSLGTGAAEDLDLAGTLPNPFAANVVLVKLKTLIIVADPTNTTVLTIAPKTGNALPFLTGTTPALTLPPGGAFMLHNPSLAAIAVTAGTTDQITITNAAGATAKYKIIAIGTTA